MKSRTIIVTILFSAVILYCARVFIVASINATGDSLNAYYSILGWLMYLIGVIGFVGGLAITLVLQIHQLFDN